MRYIAAYLLLKIGGNDSPTSGDIKKVLSAVGIEADDERLNKLLSELKGKDINEVSWPNPRALSPGTDLYAVCTATVNC